MEACNLLFFIAVFFSAVLFSVLLFPSKKPALPPGPLSIPLLGNLFWLRQAPSPTTIENLLRSITPRIGPIVTLRIGLRPSIFITDRSLAHKALIELGAVFSSRPPPPPASRFFNSGIPNISSAPYGNIWRLLRRNLTSEILHPAKVRLFSDGRRWVLGLLLKDLDTKSQESPQCAVVAMESFQFAMFALLVFMCFGQRLDEKAIREIEAAQRELILYATTYLRVFSFFPRLLSGILFRDRLRKVERLRRRQRELFLPLINTRREHAKQRQDDMFLYSYVDSLLDITIAEDGGRQLTDDELIGLCGEFLTGGTDTTATALQWIMAEIVAQPAVQAKLAEEVEGINGTQIKEDDLQKMPYLKAVVMEGLRRHPPAHFVLPHSVTEDIKFEGYAIPKNVSVNFFVADLGWDEKVWEKPMEFLPERFMAGGEGEGMDITGSREIKMMPFGVGRRICPGLGLAILHLEYFVANLIKEFEWKAMEGVEVDLSEKSEFTVVMKNSLRARLAPRRKSAQPTTEKQLT